MVAGLRVADVSRVSRFGGFVIKLRTTCRTLRTKIYLSPFHGSNAPMGDLNNELIGAKRRKKTVCHVVHNDASILPCVLAATSTAFDRIIHWYTRKRQALNYTR